MIETVRRSPVLRLQWVVRAGLRRLFLFITITVCAGSFTQLAAQQVTTVAPPADADTNSQTSSSQYPDAVPAPAEARPAISLDSAGSQTLQNGRYILNDHVVLTYKGRTLRADHMEYDQNTGDVTLTGHILAEGGENDEHIEASHGTFNLRTETGRFYDVSGSIGIRRPAVGPMSSTARAVYANSNPFLFTARVLSKDGPRDYAFDHGTFTSCQLPRPDWLLSAAHFRSNGTTARAGNTVFRMLGVPLLWLPYATHPVDTSSRQTGILIPEIGINSASKGNTIGEQVYWAINRSTDMTVGTIYYSARGWERTAGVRYRGLGQDFARANYNALDDRGYLPVGSTVRVNQSGTDVLFSGRKDLIAADEATPESGAPAPSRGQARVVADVEYLSSFPYREAFSSNFNQAVSSDVISNVYALREWDGMAVSLEGDRYEGEKRVASLPFPQCQTFVPSRCEEQVRIFHAPSIEFATTDRRLGQTRVLWNIDSSLTALKRTQPGFATSGMVERLDLHPELALPLHFSGWNARASLGGRNTFYSRGRVPPVPGVPSLPVESTTTVNRGNVEATFDLRPPVLERTFSTPGLRRLFGSEVKHTIEPQLTYRYIRGIDNFSNVLRFDSTDIASDTNELEYGATQRLFVRRSGNKPCRAAGSAADATEILGYAGRPEDAIEAPGEAAGRQDEAPSVCSPREWISWRVAQKLFLNSHFGGAVTTTTGAVPGTGPRSVLQTTLDFSGISFLTGPRDLSPLISRLRVRTSEKLDVEWDFDYDAVSSRFTANNFYADAHWGDPAAVSGRYIFAGIGYARLNAPARSYVEGVLSSVADFNQMRVLLGFGKPTRPGLSAAASAGIDLNLGSVQYGAIQTSYNWNCCGLSVEYRKYELGSARNDNGYKFNFTLANIGSAGNLRHSQQVF